MHIGATDGPDRERPLLRFSDGRIDGAASADGLVRGVYVHGLFGHDAQRAQWLRWFGADASGLRFEQSVESVLDGLAEHLGRHVNLDSLLRLARGPG
jgi:adenosylcobyric acid synthase